MSSKKTPIRKDGSPLSIAKALVPDQPAESDHQDQNPFPLESLPEDMRKMVEEVASVFHVPVSVVGIVALGVASGSLGKNLEVQSGPHITRGNLFLIQGINSGTGKSAGANPIFEPYKRFEREHNSEQSEVIQRARSFVAIRENELKKSKDVDEHMRLNAAIEHAKLRACELELMVEDTTISALEQFLAGSNGVAFSYSTDARSPLQNIFGKHNKGVTDEGIYLKGYSGREPHKTNRTTRENAAFSDICISLCWSVQIDLVREAFQKSELLESGFLPRILVSMPYTEWDLMTSDRTVSEEIQTRWSNVIKALLGKFRMGDSAHVIGLAPEGKRHLDAMKERCTKLCNANRDVGALYARWPENALRIAVVLHAAAHQEEAATNDISGETMASAIALMGFFGENQMSIMRDGRASRHEAIYLDLKDRANGKACALPWEVAKTRHASNTEEAKSLLKRLAAEGYGFWETRKPSGLGRPTTGLWFARTDGETLPT